MADFSPAFHALPRTAQDLGCTAELIQGYLVVVAPTEAIATIVQAYFRAWSIPVVICLDHVGGRPYALLQG